ncbi:Protein of unknown function [Lactobacillus delbrueckii subsp. bulgaricus]|nr:Protein of unknown function [Lactobacillus delbrueckii subsp. bulgaricus]CDR75775.1 Protein of unknown function [Lactobacillus delbrueckii subsp. bulgaricus]
MTTRDKLLAENWIKKKSAITSCRTFSI